MKLNKLSQAVAAVCAVASAPAFALVPDGTNNLPANTLSIRISGATAVDPGFAAAALRLCTSTSIHRYSISNNTVIFCTINTTTFPGAGKTNLAFHKFSQGGSGGGVANVNQGNLIPFVNLAEIIGGCTAPVVTAAQDVDGTNPLPTFVDTLCSNSFSDPAVTNPEFSFIGVSDVEPQFFGASANTYDNLLAESLATVIFAPPVTRTAYIALQKAQGLVVGFGGTCAIDSQTEACLPSLSQGQLTSMYTQPDQSWLGLTGAVIADDKIYVARRASTSGTQKTFEALIGRTTNSSTGGRECQSGVDPFVSGVAAADNTAANLVCTGTNTVVNNSGSNQVITCLNKHDSGSRGAVGTLSTEYKTTTGLIRFTKINGIAPTYKGVASGQYTQYGDVSLNTRIATRNGAGPTATEPGYANFLTVLKGEFSNPATIEVVNGSNQPFGPSGLLALDVLNPLLPAPDYTGATARNPWSRLVGGTDLNNCQPGKQGTF